MTLNDPYPSFKVTPFFDAEYLINGTTYGHSFNVLSIMPKNRYFVRLTLGKIGRNASEEVILELIRSKCILY